VQEEIDVAGLCRGPIRCAVCVYVAAVLRRGGCTSISEAYFFRTSFAADVSVSMVF